MRQPWWRRVVSRSRKSLNFRPSLSELENRITPSLGPANPLVNDPTDDATDQDTQSETTLFVSSTVMLAGYNDSGSNVVGNNFTGYARSTDGGASFTDMGVLPGNNDAGDPVLAGNTSGGGVAPGRIYMATLESNLSRIQIFRSDNDGLTFSGPVNGFPGSTSADFLDKEWISVDNFSGTGQGFLYAVTMNFGGGAGLPSGIIFTRSTDGGISFSTALSIANTGATQGAWVTVGSDHSVYVFWLDGSGANNEIRMRRSTDNGASFGGAVTVATHTGGAANGDLGLDFRTNSFPQVVVNPASGHLYCIFPDNPAGMDRGNIFFTMSTNNGATWTPRVQVNDDTGNQDQFFPSIAVSPNGTRVFASWYDRRNDPANSAINTFASVGTVAGATVTWGGNFRLSDNAFPQSFGVDPAINPAYMGDYDQAQADANNFYFIWGDNRLPSNGPGRAGTNQQDVRFAKVDGDGPAGPMPINATPSVNATYQGLVTGFISNITVDFDRTMNTGSFAIGADVLSFTGPGGVDLMSRISGFTWTDANTLSLTISPQLALNGDYQLTLGPNLLSQVGGLPMDVDVDGVAGEPIQDQYDIIFTIFGNAPPPSGVTGVVYNDVNSNNNRDGGEAGMAGVVVFADLNLNGTFEGGNQAVDSTNVPVGIFDFTTVTSSLTINIPGNFPITDVNLLLGDLDHTWDADIAIVLISPSGTRIDLSMNNGDDGDGYTNTLFDDEAGPAIGGGTAPFIGSFRPDEPLSNLDGELPNGLWRLEITDGFAQDQGSLNAWRLIVMAGEISTVSGVGGAYTLDINPGTYRIREITPADLTPTEPPGGFHLVTVNAQEYTPDIEFGNFNPPPTATMLNNGPVPEGGSVNVFFTGQFDPSPTQTAAGFRYSYDFNNDGDFFDVGEIGDGTYANSTTSSAVPVPASYLQDGPGTMLVHGRIIDSLDGFTDYTTTITLTNSPPTATFGNNGPVSEGSASASVTFTGQTDPSTADIAAGFRYSYDFNNDGIFDMGDGLTYAGSVAGASQNIPGSFLQDNPGATIRARIFDKDGGFTEYTTLIIVNNVFPTALFSNGGPVDEGSNTGSVLVSGQFDPGPADTAAGFRYSFDFDNDGNWELGNGGYAGSVTSPSQIVPAGFLADNPGTTIRVRILDKDNGFSEYTTFITVFNISPSATFTNSGAVLEDHASTIVFSNPFDPGPVDTAAGLRFSYDFNNDGDFSDPGEFTDVLESSKVLPFSQEGTYAIHGRIKDKDGLFTDYVTNITVQNIDQYVTGQDKGGQPIVRVYDSNTGVEKFTITPYPLTYKGGVRVATADVDGDGILDIITAPGAGGKAAFGTNLVRVFNGSDGTPLPGVLGTGFAPFGSLFKKGYHVAAGDLNLDGKAEIVVAPNGGFSPTIKVYDGVDGTSVLLEFSPFPLIGPYKKGVRLAIADVTGNGTPDIIAAAGSGATSVVKVFEGLTALEPTAWFGGKNPFADMPTVKGPIFVAAGDFNGDGKADIVAAPGKGAPMFRIINGVTAVQLNQLNPAAPITYKGGIRVAVTDADADGDADIVFATGKAKGQKYHVRVLDGQSFAEIDSFFADPLSLFKGGAFVGGGR